MVLSVLNLQEAYAKAQLVDRAALAVAQAEGDVLRGHELLLDAYKTDVRPRCAEMRVSLGAAADPIAELRPYVERIVAERGSTVSELRKQFPWGLGSMTTLAHMIAPAEDRWPTSGEVPGDALGQVLLASHLLGADRAVANFGGGNTSAKGTATDHVGPRDRRHVGQGLGQRPGDDGAQGLHAAAPGRDARRVRARRDERRGHGRPPRALPGRPGGAALVDRDAAARLRPGPARAPHAPGRHQRACRHARRRAARRRVLRRRGRLDPLYPARASRSPSRSARRCATTRSSSSSCSPSTASSCGATRPRRRTGARSRSSTAPSTSSTPGPQARSASAARGGEARRGDAARRAARAARRGVERAAEGARRRHLGSRARVRLLEGGAGAGDRRRRLSRPSRAHEAPAAVDPVRPRRARTRTRSSQRIRERAAAYRDDYRAYVADRRRTAPADPDARVVLIQHVGLVGVGPTTKAARLVARPLPPGDRGHGGRARARRLRLARRGRELRHRVLAARAVQALAGAAARRAAGPGRAGHGRRGRHRTRRGRLAGVRRRLHRGVRPRRRGRHRGRRRSG